MILILSYPLLILEVLWWVDGENKNLKSHWTGRSFTKKPWQEVSTLYMYICKLSMVFFLVTKTYRNASERSTDLPSFMTLLYMRVWWFHDLSQTLTSCNWFLMLSWKVKLQTFWSFRVPDSQINPKKMLSGHVWLHSATKCADFLFLLFQDGCQQNTGQNVESTKCKL